MVIFAGVLRMAFCNHSGDISKLGDTKPGHDTKLHLLTTKCMYFPRKMFNRMKEGMCYGCTYNMLDMF